MTLPARIRLSIATTPETFRQCADIWLAASLGSHSFVPAAFWHRNYAALLTDYLPASTTYIADLDGPVAAFASVKDGFMAALFVSPPFQGRGLGSTLLGHVLSLHGELSLTVYAKNTGAIAFYERFGFRVMARQHCAHSGEEEFLMGRSVPGSSHPDV